MSGVMPRLWLNPWAARTLEHDLPFSVSRLHDERFINNARAGTDANTLVGLPPDWPGKPFQETWL
jgi:hypothetical protein